jgi:hypothetical protein
MFPHLPQRLGIESETERLHMLSVSYFNLEMLTASKLFVSWSDEHDWKMLYSRSKYHTRYVERTGT